MSKYLRTVSTRRLLGTIAAAAIIIGGGTAIAVAAAGNGPVPQPASLPMAIHTALSGPTVTGFSADISFTNHLIDSGDLQGADPLLSGASGRVWYSPALHSLRLELQSDNGDAQVVAHDGSFWISDPRSNTVYEGTLPQHHADASPPRDASDNVPSVADIQARLNKLAQHLDLSGATPGDTGGQPTYSVRITPKHDGGLLGAAQVAFDAVRGVPLDVGIYASGDSTPVLELQASNVSYGPVDASVFNLNPPAGDKVVKVSEPSSAHVASAHAHATPVTGVSAVTASLPFPLAAPATVAGLPRRTVAKLDWGGTPGAVVTYGQGIGGIAVVERPADHGTGSGGLLAGNGDASGKAGSGGGHAPVQVPTVSIDGITAPELDTALGTIITFTRNGVSYMVLGSVPPTAAEAAATDIAKSLG